MSVEPDRADEGWAEGVPLYEALSRSGRSISDLGVVNRMACRNRTLLMVPPAVESRMLAADDRSGRLTQSATKT